MKLNIVILAAGRGTRMRSEIPKVMHTIGGVPILEHVINTAFALKSEQIHIIFGKEINLVRPYFKGSINWIEQPNRLGTGHALLQALKHIEINSNVLVLYGDVPLVSVTTLKRLIKIMPKDGLSLLSANVSEPGELGRVLRDGKGNVISIVEYKDATKSERQISEINTGILVTTSQILHTYLPRICALKVRREYYLTDIIKILVEHDISVRALLASNPVEVLGVNDQKQRAEVERQYQKLKINRLMLKGLVVMDPERLDLRGELVFGSNVVIDVNTVLDGDIDIGSNSAISQNNYLKNVRIGNNVIIMPNCVIEDAIIGDNCKVGPFARIRAESILGDGVSIGNFMEVKNTKIGYNSRAKHIGYIGDTIIGKDVNIGAGTITCNYDGVKKHQTVIENGAFIGSNCTLVSPIVVGRDGYIGAGSVITRNVPRNKLTIARVRQVTVKSLEKKAKKKA